MIFVGKIWDEKQVVNSYSYYYSIALNDVNGVLIPMTWILMDTIGKKLHPQAHSRYSEMHQFYYMLALHCYLAVWANGCWSTSKRSQRQTRHLSGKLLTSQTRPATNNCAIFIQQWICFVCACISTWIILEFFTFFTARRLVLMSCGVSTRPTVEVRSCLECQSQSTRTLLASRRS